MRLCRDSQVRVRLGCNCVSQLPRALSEQPARLRASLQPRRRALLVEELRAGRDRVRRGPRFERGRQLSRRVRAASRRIAETNRGSRRRRRALGRSRRSTASQPASPPTVRPVAMPETVQRLARAREIYLSRVSPQRDTEGVRTAYDYNNALLLYWYGYWPQAEAASRASTKNAARAPRPMRPAKSPGRIFAPWRWPTTTATRFAGSRPTSRSAAAPSPRAPTGSTAASQPIATSRFVERARTSTRSSIRTRSTSTSEPARRRAPNSVLLYEQSATMLLAAVNSNPNDRQAPLALEYAALALEATNRFDSAAQLYQRIIDEVGPREAEDAEEQKSLDAILANAHFKLALHGEPQLRLRPRGRELPGAGGFAALRQVDRSQRCRASAPTVWSTRRFCSNASSGIPKRRSTTGASTPRSTTRARSETRSIESPRWPIGSNATRRRSTACASSSRSTATTGRPVTSSFRPTGGSPSPGRHAAEWATIAARSRT